MRRSDRLPLREALATREGKRRTTRRIFATIADRYDLITVLLSGGLDRRWKARLLALAAPRPGERALDAACGTGDLAFALAARGARVVGLDVTARMLELARRRGAGPALVQADMLAIPAPAETFDLVTTGYGLRNAPDLDEAIGEVRRVLRPGGRFVSLDFARPENRAVRAVYLAYLGVVGSALGLALHGDPDTYRYIPETLRRYPGPREIAARLEAAGFERVEYIPVLGGLMALHRAVKPGGAPAGRAGTGGAVQGRVRRR